MEHHRTKILPSKSIILSMMSSQALRARLSCAMCKHKFIEVLTLKMTKKTNATSGFLSKEESKLTNIKHREIYQYSPYSMPAPCSDQRLGVESSRVSLSSKNLQYELHLWYMRKSLKVTGRLPRPNRPARGLELVRYQ